MTEEHKVICDRCGKIYLPKEYIGEEVNKK